MPLRRVSSNGSFGYGSFGATITEPEIISSFTFLDELPYIKPYIPALFNLDTPLYAYGIVIRWRWKFVLINADLSKTQTYNAEIGKRRYGVCVVSQSNYVSSEHFLSFDSQISDLFTTAYVIHSGSGESDLPCDEPPSDTPITVVPEARWLCKSTPYITFLPGLSPDTASGHLGESFTVVPVESVKSYIIGGSYMYSLVQLYSQDDYENVYGRPPSINL